MEVIEGGLDIWPNPLKTFLVIPTGTEPCRRRERPLQQIEQEQEIIANFIHYRLLGDEA